MKVRDYLRQPDIKWVAHVPYSKTEACFFTALCSCYPDSQFRNSIRVLMHKHIGEEDIVLWNDRQTSVDAVLKVVDELDI